jgi:hypothetical protein
MYYKVEYYPSAGDWSIVQLTELGDNELNVVEFEEYQPCRGDEYNPWPSVYSTYIETEKTDPQEIFKTGYLIILKSIMEKVTEGYLGESIAEGMV